MKLYRTERFRKALLKLNSSRQDAVRETLKKLLLEPIPSGLRLEKLGGYSALYSVRINRGDRVILKKVEDGFELADVGSHDLYRHQKNK